MKVHSDPWYVKNMDAPWTWKTHTPEEGNQVGATRTSTCHDQNEMVLVLDPNELEVAIFDPLMCHHPDHVVATETIPMDVLIRLMEMWGFKVTRP